MLLIDFVGLEEEERKGWCGCYGGERRFGHIVCAGGSGYGVLLLWSMFCFISNFDPNLGGFILRLEASK